MLSDFISKSCQLWIDCSEGINNYLPLDALNWIQNNRNSTLIELLKAELGVNINV
jgi:hypothetical protein